MCPDLYAKPNMLARERVPLVEGDLGLPQGLLQVGTCQEHLPRRCWSHLGGLLSMQRGKR